MTDIVRHRKILSDIFNCFLKRNPTILSDFCSCSSAYLLFIYVLTCIFYYLVATEYTKHRYVDMANIIITSVISGIHRTKVGSHRDVKLIVENDDSIQHIDPNCMVVRIPPIEDIPAELHRVVSYPRSRNPGDPRQTDQLIYQVAGRKVGNVPSNLCGLFRRLKQERKVKDIHW